MVHHDNVPLALATCKSQVTRFKAVIEQMSSHRQGYVSDHELLPTNSVEGFHGPPQQED